MFYRILVLTFLITIVVACAPEPTSIPTPAPTPKPVITPQVVITADPPTPTPTSTTASATAQPTWTATPTPARSILEEYIENLHDLRRLPIIDRTIATQYASRNWKSLEHFFDWFIDDGNFVGSNYGYIAEDGKRYPYRIVPGYDGKPEYEIVPLTKGPGIITRIWFAHQQHQSINNPKDMSHDEDWANWGNLGEVGNIRFYFDDEMVPRINVGIKDLFVGKFPFPPPLAAFYASANGGNINYVPLPFRQSIRIATTGRPRMMQIQVKRFIVDEPGSLASVNAPSNSANNRRFDNLQSFSMTPTAAEQAAIERAAQAWHTCTPSNVPNFQTYELAIPNNQSAEVQFNQPATIAGMRVRVPRGMEDSVWLQVFWDGESQPSMNASLRAMFSTAEKLLPYRSLPIGFIDSLIEHQFYLNFPMPFRSARIVFLNERAETLPLTLEIALRESIPGTENTRLHTFFGTRRLEKREDDDDNYVVIDVNGRGKYLGMILNAWDLDRRALNGPLDEHWRFPYLESNVDVWVDGRLALPGTGIEDDFNASYYYVFAGYPGYNTKYCLAGVTLLDYSTRKEPSSQYRFYLNDAPDFNNRLRVEVQHGNKGNNLSVTYSSTAFWYQMR